MARDLSLLVEKIKTSKWLIEQGAFNGLIDGVALAASNPNLQISSTFYEDEFQLSGGFPQEAEGTAIIEVNGKIVKGCPDWMCEFFGLCDPDAVGAAIDEANADNSIDSIVLMFNSGGGEATGIEELARKIAANPKPILCWTEHKAQSAAYWLMSQGQALGMSPSAAVGSVGCYVIVDDQTAMMDQMGIKKEIFSAGRFKMMMAPIRKLTDEERGILQRDVEAVHFQFKDAILAMRQVKTACLEGLSYEGKEALQGGMVDIVCDNFTEFLSVTMKNKPSILTKIKAVFSPPPAPAVAAPAAPAPVVTAPAPVVELASYGAHYVKCPFCTRSWELDDADSVKDEEEKKKEEAAKLAAKQLNVAFPDVFTAAQIETATTALMAGHHQFVANGVTYSLSIVGGQPSWQASAGAAPAPNTAPAARPAPAPAPAPVAAAPVLPNLDDSEAWRKTVGTHIERKRTPWQEACAEHVRNVAAGPFRKQV
jgi:signal peptide peptidase SppA